MGLSVLAKPTQEMIRSTQSFRRHLEVVAFEHLRDEHCQLVNREHRAHLASGQSRKQLVGAVWPIRGIDLRSELDPQIRDAKVVHFAGQSPEGTPNGAPNALERPTLDSDLSNRILWGERRFNVNEDRQVVSARLEPAQEFPDRACLSHPTLGRQQRVHSIADSLLERPQFGFPVKDAVAVNPIRPCVPQHEIDLFRAGTAGRLDIATEPMPSSLLQKIGRMASLSQSTSGARLFGTVRRASERVLPRQPDRRYRVRSGRGLTLARPVAKKMGTVAEH